MYLKPTKTRLKMGSCTQTLQKRSSLKVHIDQTSQTTLFMSSEVFKAVSLSRGATDTLIQDVSV